MVIEAKPTSTGCEWSGPAIRIKTTQISGMLRVSSRGVDSRRTDLEAVSMTKLRRVVAAIASTVLLIVAGYPSAQAATADGVHPSGPARDTVTVAGYNFEVSRPADVVVGDTGAALKISYTAGGALNDGTIQIALPHRQWPTPLRTVPGFYGNALSATDNGGVSVLPAENLPGSGNMCRGRGENGEVEFTDWSTTTLSGLQLITVRHVTCDPGAQLIVRIKGISAPGSVGRQLIPVSTYAPGRSPRLSVGTVSVVPVPKITLSVTLPPPEDIVAGQLFTIKVSPLGPNGPAENYRGTVAVLAEPDDCTLTPRGVAHEFTGGPSVSADIRVSLSLLTAHRLRVYDVSNRAVDGVSSPFDVIPADVFPFCPASFH